MFLITAVLAISCYRKNYNNNKALRNTITESQELNIETEDSILISGNLEYATNKKLVIFIAGSGPTDRDCNNNGGLKTNAFKMLALYLKQEGISIFGLTKEV